MNWTIRDIIQKAYGELGFASYAFDMQPEQYESARATLDAMIAEWSVGQTFVFYPFGASLDDQSNIPAEFLAGAYLNLAVRLGPSVGKEPAPQTLRAAKSGLDAIKRAQVRVVTKTPRPGAIPSGAGNSFGALYQVGWDGIDSEEA